MTPPDPTPAHPREPRPATRLTEASASTARTAAEAAVSGVVGLDAVVFDMDGTLIDSMSVVTRAYSDCIRGLGGPTLSEAEVLDAFPVGPPAALLAHFLKRPTTSADLEYFQQTFESLGTHVAAFPGIVDVVARLAEVGLALAIFTGAGRRSAAFLLARAGLDQHVHTVIGGDEVSRAKPAPDGLLVACRRLGAAPHRTAYVGDSEVDIGCAHRAGAWAVHAGWGAARPLRSAPDVCVYEPERLPDLVIAHHDPQ